MGLDLHFEVGDAQKCFVCDENGYVAPHKLCRACGGDKVIGVHTVFDANITHNLGEMAQEAGLYDVLWRPEDCGISRAEQMIPALTVGISTLKDDPVRFEAFNSPNGWGLYKNFVPWVERVLVACNEYPMARVIASR